MKNYYPIKKLFIISLFLLCGMRTLAQFADLGCGSVLMERNMISVGQTSVLEADIRNFGFTDIIPGGALVTISVPSAICSIVSVNPGTNPIWAIYSSSLPASITLRNSMGVLPADFSSYTIKLNVKAIKAGDPLIINCSATLAPGFIQAGALALGELNPINNAQRSSVGVLPARMVKLYSFDASVSACTTLLKWTATQEENCKEYQVQVSHDGVSFATIGTIVSGGESSSSRSYQYTDNVPPGGNNQYRLRITDMDGKVSYSSEKTVLITCDSKRIILYPNPIAENKTLHVNIAGYSNNLKGELSDASGKMAGTFKMYNGVNTLHIENTSTGNYMLKVTDLTTGQSESFRFVIIK